MAKTYRILSLSGGGVRGLITAIWLNRLEQKLGGTIAPYFDLIAGTSTGSLIACAVAMGMKSDRIVDLYRTQSTTIFPAPVPRFFNRALRLFSQGFDAPRYDGRGLESVLRSAFGDTAFGTLQVRTLVTSYDLQNREALVFKTNKPEHQSIPIWEICKASSAAPVYFPAHLLRLNDRTLPVIDGGVVANNPTACAIAEGVRLSNEGSLEERVDLNQFIVASFGTGETTAPITIEQSQNWGALGWVMPLIDVLFDGSADAVDYIARQVLADAKYFRFQTPVGRENGAIDDARPENLSGLTRIAETYLASTGDALLDQLVSTIRSE